MSEEKDLTSLILGDRINWPFILGTSVLNFFNSVVKMEGEQSEQEVREAAITMYNSIPSQWVKADDQFRAELKEAIKEREVDARREWCGKKIGKLKTKQEEYIDPYKLYHSCVNVFQRRGLLSKTIFTEKIVPEPADFEGQENQEETKE